MKNILSALAGILILAGCGVENDGFEPTPASPDVPRNFPPVPVPSNNPLTHESFELGRRLFYDKAFAQDYSVSCGSCHQPAAAFSDGGKAVSAGFHGLTGTRNAPGLTNVAWGKAFLWEGGVPTLEQQVLAPIINPVEFNINPDTLVMRLSRNPVYPPMFEKAWGDQTVTLERITKSIATFERFLVSGQSEFDKWNRGESNSMSESAKRGFDLFFGEDGDCFHCHGGFNFTDDDFHNNSLAAVYADGGRFLLTNRDEDVGKFKTPTLRNVELSAPYMHDGSLNSLEEVVNHYNSGGKGHPNADILMRPLNLTPDQVTDLVNFLKSLTDTSFTNNPDFHNPVNYSGIK